MPHLTRLYHQAMCRLGYHEWVRDVGDPLAEWKPNWFCMRGWDVGATCKAQPIPLDYTF